MGLNDEVRDELRAMAELGNRAARRTLDKFDKVAKLADIDEGSGMKVSEAANLFIELNEILEES